jgi:hypothetical protein
MNLNTTALLPLIRAAADQIRAETPYSLSFIVDLVLSVSEERHGLPDDQVIAAINDQLHARLEPAIFFAPLVDCLANSFPLLQQPIVREALFCFDDGPIALAVLCAAALGEPAETVGRYRTLLYREIAYGFSSRAMDEAVSLSRQVDGAGQPTDNFVFVVQPRNVYHHRDQRPIYQLPATEGEMRGLCWELDVDFELGLDEDEDATPASPFTVDQATQEFIDFLNCYRIPLA